MSFQLHPQTRINKPKQGFRFFSKKKETQNNSTSKKKQGNKQTLSRCQGHIEYTVRPTQESQKVAFCSSAECNIFSKKEHFISSLLSRKVQYTLLFFFLSPRVSTAFSIRRRPAEHSGCRDDNSAGC